VPKPMVLAPGHVKVIKQGSVDTHSSGIFSGRIRILQRVESQNAEVPKRMRIVHLNVQIKHDHQS
jgi:hypothetical protein